MTFHLLSSSKELSAEALNSWGDTIGSRTISRAIAASERFSDRVLDRIASQSNLGHDAASSNPHDVMVAKALRADAKRFVRICGIVIYSDVFRKITVREEFAEVQRNFSHEDLRIGCRIDGERVIFGENAIDLSRLPELAQSAGQQCVSLWLNMISPALKDELAMVGVDVMQFAGDQDQGIKIEQAINIVRSVANAMGYSAHSRAHSSSGEV